MSSCDPSLEPSDAKITENDLSDFKTLEQFILEQQDRFPHSTGAFSRLLRDIGLAAKIVNRDMRRAGIDDISGTTGRTNVQGETQQKKLTRLLTVIVEQAGGRATDEAQRILEKSPEALHQRTPLFIGSPEMVTRVESFLAGEAGEGGAR